MRKSSLATLILFTCAGGAEAMHLDPSGLGQALVAPYYTVNAGHQTLLSVRNQTNRGKALKVRFLEGRNGREVLGFNIYLAPRDLWTGAVFSLADDGAAQLITLDDSCTVPAIKTSTTLPQLANGRRVLPFSNAQFSGALDDAGPNELTRTREGYFEIIEMGEVINAGQHTLDDISPAFNGIPANCARLNDAWLPQGYWTANAETDLTVPDGGIAATVSLINTLEGTLYTYQAEAIDAFSSIVQHSNYGSAMPNLSTAVSNAGEAYVEAVVEVGNGLVTSRYPLSRAIDAVSALFMAARIDNEFNTSPSSGARSDWVMTLPTKKFYTDDAIVTGDAIAPFRVKFSQSARDEDFPDPERPGVGAFFCPLVAPPRGEEIGLWFFKRDEFMMRRCDADMGGCMTICRTPSIYWASNVFGFQGAWGGTVDPDNSLFGSQLNQQFPSNDLGVSEGWMNLTFFDAESSGFLPQHLLRADASGRRYKGLPVVALWAASYTNTNVVPGVLGNYASARKHRSAAGFVATP